MKIRLIVIFLVFCIFGIVAYFINKNFIFAKIPEGSVRVDFVNETNQALQIVIVNESNQTRNKPVADFTKTINIPIGKTQPYIFENDGEGTFKYNVELESGKKLKEQEHYVEARYYLKEIIREDSIFTDRQIQNISY